MHVLHVTRDFPPYSTGGISQAVGGLVRALTAVGHRCTVLSFDGWRPSKASRVDQAPVRCEHKTHNQIIRITGTGALDAARTAAERSRPDIIHVHHGMLWPFARALHTARQAPSIFMVHVHQSMMNRLRGVTERTASLLGQERALREADLVLTPSEACARALHQEHPDLALRSAPLGIFDSAAARRSACAKRDPERPELLYVGRFGDIKGTQEFFELAAALLKRWPRLRISVVGGVPANGKAERRWRRRWASLCPIGCETRIQFAGWATSEALSAHYASASLLVVPSWTETFGLTALEGMLHGLAVVASDCPALRELDGPTGCMRFVPPRDSAALVRAVDDLLDAPLLARDLGAAAAQHARRAHLWGDRVDAYEALYLGLLKSQSDA